jgi:hypothetical protein
VSLCLGGYPFSFCPHSDAGNQHPRPDGLASGLRRTIRRVAPASRPNVPIRADSRNSCLSHQFQFSKNTPKKLLSVVIVLYRVLPSFTRGIRPSRSSRPLRETIPPLRGEIPVPRSKIKNVSILSFPASSLLHHQLSQGRPPNLHQRPRFYPNSQLCQSVLALARIPETLPPRLRDFIDFSRPQVTSSFRQTEPLNPYHA